jgi:hypothetical protein
MDGKTFDDPVEDAIAVAHAVVWATVTTVDPVGRPRNRILHPLWVPTADGLDGWILTRRTSVKVRHLEANPHVSCSYLATSHDVAFFDCVAAWADRPTTYRAWMAFIASPAPVGYDPSGIFPAGPDASDVAALHLRPYRVQVGRATALARGQKPRLWVPAGPLPPAGAGASLGQGATS